jgi:hypothetical protein
LAASLHFFLQYYGDSDKMKNESSFGKEKLTNKKNSLSILGLAGIG